MVQETMERNSGIDFLRLILMYMIVIIHLLGHGGILIGAEVDIVQYSVYYLIKSIVTCSVDCFALMSGYISSNKENQSYHKIIEMWLQVFFYSFIFSLILEVSGISSISGVKTYFRRMIPVTGEMYWYFTAFFALFFLRPYINKCLNQLSRKQTKELLIILFLLFSIQGVLSDPYKLNDGFSAFWIIILYVIGNLIRRLDLFVKSSIMVLFTVFVCMTLMIWLPIVLFKSTLLTNSLSPFIVIQGILLLLIFSKLRINSKIISKLSPFAFGVYLFHENALFREKFIVEKFIFINNYNVVYGVFIVLACAFVIFVLGLLLDWIRSLIFKLLRITERSYAISSILEKKIKN